MSELPLQSSCEVGAPASAEGPDGSSVLTEADPIQREMVQWLVLRHSGEWTAADEQALMQWLNESPQRLQAWERMAQRLGGLRSAPSAVARSVLNRSTSSAVSRRRVWGQLVWLSAVPLVSWLAWSEMPWRTWNAGYRTATGEQRRVWLADGSEVLLNTATALDVHFTESQRLLQLHQGELQVTTASALGVQGAASLPPLVVQTSGGTVRALGTRFSVRHEGSDLFRVGHEGAQVNVFEGGVAVSLGHDSTRVGAGQQIHFGTNGLGPVSEMDEVQESAWAAGLLVANRMPLENFVAEVGRYRPGVLRLSPRVRHLEISGVFPVLEPDRCLYLLTQTLPVRLQTVTPLWTTVVPV